MRALDFDQVKLRQGMLKDKLDEMAAFYRGLSNDDILHYMRLDAGLPAPGQAWTGWYAHSRGMGTLGQWVSAYARLYALTGNEQDKAKAIDLIDTFWLCHDHLEDTPKALLGRRSHYAFEKLVQAHCDLQVYAQVPTRDRVMRLVRFARETLDRTRAFGDNSTEWYTMPEALFNAARIFDLPEAAEEAETWLYRDYWDQFAEGRDPFARKPEAGLYSDFCHAYSHVNSFNSCAAAYRHSHDPVFLKALITFYRFMTDTQVMATGGYGPEFEHLMPRDRIVNALRTSHDSFETQCDSYAAFRLCRHLTEIDGEAEYGDWVESLIYNAVLATVPMTPEGKVIYYSDYNMYGASKVNRQDNWTCCTGTRPLLVLDMVRQLYYEDGSGLAVSQYAPSEASWTRSGQTVRIRQETNFPLDDTVKFQLTLSSPDRFTLYFRRPAWLAGPMDLHVNGQIADACEVRGYLALTRRWQDGDQIELTVPQKLWMHALDKEKNGPNAFLHGPVVLGATYTGPQTPNDHMNVRRLPERMRPVPGQKLHYTVDGCDQLTFKPFYAYQEHERYFVYHDTTAHATIRFP